MRLSVNIDHVATLRQARKGRDPEPVTAAALAELAGGHGITVHLRADRRHMQERDLYLLRETVRRTLNVEVAATPDGLAVMKAVKPDQVTLVPERPEELTTEGGLDLLGRRAEVAEYLALYREAGITVSLFINPDAASVRAAVKLRPAIVELNTAEYGAAAAGAARDAALDRVREAARLAAKGGLAVHAGHDLNYLNAGGIASVGEIVEVSIGHALVARAALTGIDAAVREMLARLNGSKEEA